MTAVTEADVEDAALEWLDALGWQTVHGPDIGPSAVGEERAGYGAVVLERRLRDALARLNPDLPHDAFDDHFRKLTRPDGSTIEARNRAFHRMLVEGVTVEYRTDGGARPREPRCSRRRREQAVDAQSPPQDSSCRLVWPPSSAPPTGCPVGSTVPGW